MAGNTSALEPSVLIIFGVTGDLAQRYLMPALYHLIKEKLLHEDTVILGVTRGDMSTEQLFDKVELCVNEIDNTCDPAVLQAMRNRTEMFKMNLENKTAYQTLLAKLNALEDKKGLCLNRLYYLSVPPQAYTPIIHLLGENGLNRSCQHGKAATRLLVEKPFGFDLESAQALISQTASVFQEDQIFRIDHYMAKETVQNILTFRFQNPIFEALWDKRYIAGIEISAKQTIGIEGRSAFYEPLGALRDLIQNHLLQILGLITMEKPAEFSSRAIHAAKQAALEQIEPVPAAEVEKKAMRGQYKGYRDEVGNSASVTETFAALNVYLHNDRWKNVPIKLLTGKALDEQKTEVCVNFHDKDLSNNRLRFRIQPNEGIELDLITKKPGFSYETQTTAMDFSYRNDFGDSSHPNAYERVLVDAVRGDHTLFATSEEVLASWRVVQPVLDAWSNHAEDLVYYEPGTMPAADI